LCGIAPEFTQTVADEGGFYAFGDDLKSQVMSELDRGSHDHVVAHLQSSHERSINFQLIDWELTQVTQR
jgi:hypothetical protein